MNFLSRNSARFASVAMLAFSEGAAQAHTGHASPGALGGLDHFRFWRFVRRHRHLSVGPDVIGVKL